MLRSLHVGLHFIAAHYSDPYTVNMHSEIYR